MSQDIGKWIGDLTSGDASVRAAAAEKLAQMTERAQAAAVELVQATADESAREWAVAALESLGPPRADDAMRLTPLLSDRRLDVAYWAATLLGRLGTEANTALPALQSAAAKHPEAEVRRRAQWAVERVSAN